MNSTSNENTSEQKYNNDNWFEVTGGPIKITQNSQPRVASIDSVEKIPAMPNNESESSNDVELKEIIVGIDTVEKLLNRKPPAQLDLKNVRLCPKFVVSPWLDMTNMEPEHNMKSLYT